MKVLKLSFALSALLILPGLVSTSSAQSNAAGQKLISGMMEALGGKTFLDVREIEAHGTYYNFRRGELTGYAVYADFIRLPDMERTELGTGREKNIRINRQEEGWLVTGRDGKDVQPMSGREIEQFLMGMKSSFDYVTRFVLNTPEATMLATGTEMVNSRRADMVEIRDSEKNLYRFLLDRDTRLPIKMQVRRAGESVINEEVYANWHRLDGVMTPLFIIRYNDGAKTMEIRHEKLVYNPGLDDSLFAPPVKK